MEVDIQLAAEVYSPVLVTAENRDQREMCARLIHASGDRARGPFVTFACNRAEESDGVGHGPHWDGALRHQFDQARGGTLFVDDIVAMTTEAQALLLSLLEEPVPALGRSTVQSLGPRVRIIAGASRHLSTERATGAFCEPLFYRLNVIHVDLTNQQPPL